MLFNSITFAIFLPVVYLLYRLLGRSFRAQNELLLVASYLFYGWWDWRFLFLIILSTTLDFCTSLMIERGKLTFGQRLEASLALIGSSLLFLAIDWRAIHVDWRMGRIVVDRGGLWSDAPAAWWGIGATVAAVIVGHLIYPLVTRLPDRTRARLALMTSIGINLGILGFFKYFNFFIHSFAAAWESILGTPPDLVTLNIILPVGISFYTFQSMSYTIDVYRGDLRASERLREYAVFVSFFPQLVAGPIERASHLLPQFQRPRILPDREGVRHAAWLIGWGLYKKTVVADNMAILVNGVFNPHDGVAVWGSSAPVHDGLRLLFAVYAFALQIYCDFSGYTDIARGAAKLFGFDIMLNFNLPYFATSPSDFWRRWHISLSTWLRDYLYISLGGNRGSELQTYRNLFLTMLLGGLWHGASWTFVAWGAYHGILLILYRLLGIRTERTGTPWIVRLPMGLLMFHLTCVGWLLFRAQNMETVRLFVTSIATSLHGSPAAWALWDQIVYYGWFLVLFQVIQAALKTLDPMSRMPWLVRLTVWVFIIMSILRLAPKTAQEFIYFAF
jgi:D-alanyl-lipoteichoic acid acyltransferase DltB (MBOAT superfamily)